MPSAIPPPRRPGRNARLEAPEAKVTGYSTRDVAHLAALSPRQVRSFARDGCLRPDRGRRGEFRFSFQDLVLLRTAKTLVAARIPPHRVRRALRQLRRQVSESRALSEIRISAVGGEIVASDGQSAWEPESGQFAMNFPGAVLAVVEVEEAAVPASEVAEETDAESWYERGLELEATDADAARDAYRRAVELDPAHADAHVNLGRLLQEEGRAAEAEAQYRRALAAAPRHATAAFDLAVVLEDLARPAEAINAYRQAIAADPALADAHFNLARLYEKRGNRAAALRHLKTYRELQFRSKE